MIVGISTSSPWTSVALFDDDFHLLWSAQAHAPFAASATASAMLREGLSAIGASARDAKRFAADLGPGSFTGLRVGIVMAKTLAYAVGAETTGATAFDLVDPLRTVVLPAARGRFFVRIPDQPVLTTGAPAADAVGYGPPDWVPTPPNAANFGALLSRLPVIDPFVLGPEYLLEPSISKPKRAFATGGENG